MSNPEPSRREARVAVAREALVLVRAALEIAGGDASVPAPLRARLRKGASCLRAALAEQTNAEGCLGD